MIYLYDQALQLPTVDLYDTLIMAMALNAAKDMYERGELQIKDFLKAYGDFLTPITADQNWWNLNVTGAARDLVNSIYARGGDPLRNARDRAQISMFLNRLPYGDMAKLKSSAKNAEAYLEARRKLELEGKYNPAIEQYAGKGLDQFSTVNDGIWDRMSPVPYENMADFSKSYFDNISPILRSASKNGISYTISEITEPMLLDIADRHFNDLVNTPQGQLMYKYYKDQLGSDEAARKAFNNAVVSGNLDRRKYADDYNDKFIEQQKLNQGWAKINQDRELFDWQRFTDSVQLGLLGDSHTNEDLSYTTQMEANSIAKYNKLAGIESPADYARTTFDIAQYWKNKADGENDPSKKKYAELMQDYWTRAHKAGLGEAEKKGILIRDKKTGELIPSKIYSKEIGLAYGAPSTGKTSVSRARELADVYYNRFISTSGGTEYDKTSADLLAGGAGEKTSFPGGAATNKYRVVQLDDKDIYFTPMRRLLVAGYNIQNMHKTAPVTFAFNEWLHSSPRLGYMVNSNTARASLPTMTGGRTREISGYARIPANELYNGFILEYMRNNDIDINQLNTEAIYNQLGLSFFKMHSRSPLNGKYQWKEAEVVEIPITRVRINSKSLEDSAWNTYHDENTGGKAAAEKKIISRQKESLNKR